ncbi:serine hydrolase [Erythrobacter sp.]|uniref:serine hydrolase n=1 Tax=Erythrobacter sp. TaxID=1042 RepID=UPI001425E5BF|nr:serine hydrolase [Erythrobacter sp.]QIQ86117.1 MAG: serine hydrolase [Erythrobacter sp.]
MIRHALVAAALLASPIAANAQEAAPPAPVPADTSAEESALEARAEQVVGLINGDVAPAEVFSDAMLAQVSPEQFAAVSKQLVSQFGPAIALQGLTTRSRTDGIIEIRMERAIARGPLVIDPAEGNRISGLLFREFEPVDDSLEKIRADLEALPGEVGAYFGPVKGNAPVLEMNAEQPFAIGSSFKLYVLAALSEEIRQGKRQWDDVVELETKSFPSGKLQDWPLGAPLTLHTLASLMISISDNTATDQLIDILGRQRVAEVMRASGHAAPGLNDPFLKTRELFLLKGGDPQRLADYRAAGPEERLAILANTAGDDLDLKALARTFDGKPIALDVEWLASAEDLRKLFLYMMMKGDPRALEVLSINAGLPDAVADKWKHVAFKGGSEPGVLHLTWLLQDESGEWHLLNLAWNNPDDPVDQDTLTLIAQRIASLGR